MNCPYPDCTRQALSCNEAHCPQCSRFLQSCRNRRCGELNRAFANFCRACGQELASDGLDWEGFKGGPQRSGLNPSEERGTVRDLKQVRSLDLGDECRSLLLCDDHLIAVSRSGRIEVVDTATRQRTAGWKIDGPVTCEPCVHRGSLYLGSKQRIVAYSLGSLAAGGGHLEPRWETAISGTPVQALLAFSERLYINVGYGDGRPAEMQILDGIGGARPTSAQSVHASPRLSTPTGGSPPSRCVFFLSEENDRVTVHWADHGVDPRPPISRQTVTGAPQDLKHYVPIAIVRNKIFAVFGEDSKLCSIDAERKVFGTVIKENVRNFALSGPNDGVLIQGGAVFFLFRNRREELTPDDRVNGPPVIVRNRAAFVGMKDGRIRWYDMSNPSVIEEQHLAEAPEEVTALASSRSYLAAGGSGGTVQLFRLVAAE